MIAKCFGKSSILSLWFLNLFLFGGTAKGRTKQIVLEFKQQARIPTSFYRPELDALRFFAFLAVFTNHTVTHYLETFIKHGAPVWITKIVINIARGGAYGVDVFFALSAYLITELILREKKQLGHIDVKAFYIRRILRIWPLFYFFVMLAFTVPFFNPPDNEFSDQYLILFLLLSGNWCVTLLGWNAGTGPVVFPLWSVSVEEQFYLIWPLLVTRLSKHQITMAAIVMILVANTTRFWQVTNHVTPQHLWGNTFAHLDSIAIGILLSVLLDGRIPKISISYRIFMTTSVIACYAILAYFDISPDVTEPITLYAVLLGYFAIPIGCLIILVAFLGVELRFGWLTYLGKISYGLYVYHVMCLFIIRKFPVLDHAILYELASLGLTIAVAALSYSVLEKPFLRLKRLFTHVQSRPV